MTDVHTPTPGREIRITELSPETTAAICEYLNSTDRFDAADRIWWDFNEFCGLWFELKYQQDSPTLFPKGKDATLQRMEQMIEAAL